MYFHELIQRTVNLRLALEEQLSTNLNACFFYY